MRVAARAFFVIGVIAAGCARLVRWRRSSRPEQAGAADVTDEARIDAPPHLVFAAIVDEHDGRRFTTRTVEVEPNRAIRVEYTEGAARGEAARSFGGIDGGTMLRRRCRTRPAGAARTLAPLLPVSKSHSHTMEGGFQRLAAYLERTRSSRVGAPHGD